MECNPPNSMCPCEVNLHAAFGPFGACDAFRGVVVASSGASLWLLRQRRAPTCRCAWRKPFFHFFFSIFPQFLNLFCVKLFAHFISGNALVSLPWDTSLDGGSTSTNCSLYSQARWSTLTVEQSPRSLHHAGALLTHLLARRSIDA